VIFEHACKLGLEGIVCKRIDLPYRPGPSKSWIKVKNKKHPAMLRVKEAFELERACRVSGQFLTDSHLRFANE
jgi:ATP-dependent DNA ligase